MPRCFLISACEACQSPSTQASDEAMSEGETGVLQSGFGPQQDAAVTKAGSLASLNLQGPERFALGDTQVVQESLQAMKAILDFGG